MQIWCKVKLLTALNLVLPIFDTIYAIGALIGAGSAPKYNLSKTDSRDDSNAYF